MPSCVVKSCKSHSGTSKKSQGITFHRFPQNNEPWKDDWLQIIRESRKESNWNPSKSSVVCSIHFEESDLYATKGGLLRVATFAVPKKFLNETSSDQASTSSATHEISSKTSKIPNEADTSSSSTFHKVFLEASNIKIEELAEENTSSVSDEVILEDSNIKIEVAEENTSSDSDESELMVEESSVQELNLQQSCQVLLNMNPINLPSSLPTDSSKWSYITVTPTPGVDFEKRRMKERIIKMQTLILSQTKKIKILNQKVRRLQNRNKSLKNVLKNSKKTSQKPNRK